MTAERIIGGNYKVTEKLGEGGMGEVFKGFDTMLEREVAIKSLRPELCSRTDIVERFRTEAIAVARMNHSHIATVYSFLKENEQWFLILEFVRGETLDKLVARRGTLPWRDAIKIVCQALDGLEHAHRLGVVHRDIKPANMMITPSGDLKLMDFGIARLLERARLTRTGNLIGTLEYMSPEQVQGKDSDARSDIYSTAIVLYELLTGHVPFQKNSDYDLIRAQVEEIPIPPCELSPQLPERLENAVLTALQKNPDDRYKSAAAFHVELQAVLQQSVGDSSNRIRTAPAETRLEIRNTASNASTSRPPVHTDNSRVEEQTQTNSNNTNSFDDVWQRYRLRFVVGVVSLVTLGVAVTLSSLSSKQTAPTPVQISSPPPISEPLNTKTEIKNKPSSIETANDNTAKIKKASIDDNLSFVPSTSSAGTNAEQNESIPVQSTSISVADVASAIPDIQNPINEEQNKVNQMQPKPRKKLVKKKPKLKVRHATRQSESGDSNAWLQDAHVERN